MFEAELKQKLKNIFHIEKVSFDEPGESQEQNVLFVDIETAKTNVREGYATAMVNGQLNVFATNLNLDHGFFYAAIDRAEPSDKKDFFFSDSETCTKIFRDKTQRTLTFVYFFSGQYDPETGQITSTDIDVEVI